MEFAPAKYATKFINYEVLLKSRRNALMVIQELDKSKGMNANGEPYFTEKMILLENEEPIGEGFIGIGNPQWVEYQGKRARVFPDTQKVHHLTRTRSVVGWDYAKKQFTLKMHYPVAHDWNEMTQQYETSLALIYSPNGERVNLKAENQVGFSLMESLANYLLALMRYTETHMDLPLDIRKYDDDIKSVIQIAKERQELTELIENIYYFLGSHTYRIESLFASEFPYEEKDFIKVFERFLEISSN